MQLSNAEKLMLVMLSEIHEKLGIEEGVDSHFVKEAIYTDNTWHYHGKCKVLFKVIKSQILLK